MNHPGLDRLWALAGEFRSKFADDWNLAFDDIGMILLRKIESISLPPFPDNCVQFATTGIDGVCFGFLDLGAGFNEESPIVMTVPCSDVGNVVVGGNLQDFLRLGVRTGYCGFDQIAYDRNRFFKELDDPDVQLDPEGRALMSRLVDEFHLTPWTDPRARLDELEVEYLPLVHARPYT